jgi:hypothetical protein
LRRSMAFFHGYVVLRRQYYAFLLLCHFGATLSHFSLLLSF